MNKPKIILTGGHLTPALAMIEVLENKGWEVIFLGKQEKKSAEAKIINQLKIQFIPITTGKLHRKLSMDAVVSLMKIPMGIIQCLYWMWKFKPRVVLSFGGYLGLPAVISAWILRIPSLIHEQTTVAGLANRISAKFVDRITVSFPESQKYFPLRKSVLTGNPVQQSLFQNDFIPVKELTDGMRAKKTVLVMCGNQGAKLINQAILGHLSELLKRYNLIHVIGSSTAQEPEWMKAMELKNNLPSEMKISYHPVRYVDPNERGKYFSMADLVVARAGANTIYDLGLLNKPALLIPLEPSLMNEQLENARMLEKHGLARVLREDDLNGESLIKAIDEAFGKLAQLKLSVEGKELFVRDAANRLYEEIEKIVI